MKMGYFFDKGVGVQRNDDKAFYWYKKSADGGNQFAQGNLALMYAQGRGTEKDLAAANSWWTKSAEQGYEEAIAFMNKIYAGVENIFSGQLDDVDIRGVDFEKVAHKMRGE